MISRSFGAPSGLSTAMTDAIARRTYATHSMFASFQRSQLVRAAATPGSATIVARRVASGGVTVAGRRCDEFMAGKATPSGRIGQRASLPRW